MAISLYVFRGNIGIIPRLEATAAAQPATTAAAQQQMPEGHPAANGGAAASLDVLVERLAERMKQNPDDARGWLMLGRTYNAMSKPDKAVAALEKAYRLAPKDPAVLTAYAEALAVSNGNHLNGRPAEASTRRPSRSSPRT